MYKKIAVPVDLAHPAKLDKALHSAAALARLYEARLFVVAITSTAPSEVAHNPDEFRLALEQFAQQHSESEGVLFEAEMLVEKDPSADLHRALDRHFHALGVDLVVMAAHVPGFRDYVFASRAGYLAAHTDLSVFVVR